MDYTVKLPECLRRLVTMRWACHFRTTLMTARSALMQAESVPNLQCKRDVVGVRKRSSRGKRLYSEDIHRYGRRNQVLSRARQAVRGQKRGARGKGQG